MNRIVLALSIAALAGCHSNGDGREPKSAHDAPQSSPPVVPQGLHLDFEQLAEGGPPPGWTAAETQGVGKLATWSVSAAPGGGRAVYVATTNQGGSFNLLLSPQVQPADLAFSARVRADAGEEDRGGGLVWRAKGAGDYYVARWNPLEENLRVYKVIGSVRTMLQNADCKAAGDTWHTLRVTMVDAHIQVAFDGATLLDTRDASLPGAGRVGLWTKADASTWFDDLELGEPAWPDQR
jgi:hypothetical protein